MKRGSLLITALWILSILSIMALNLGFTGSVQMSLFGKQRENFKSHCDFFSAISIVRSALTRNLDFHADSFEIPPPWNEDLQIEVRDEESKINLNQVGEAWLKQFLKQIDRKDLLKPILERRAKSSFVSLEELLLIEDVTFEDFKMLQAFVTVYTETHLININTVSEPVFSSLVHSISNDDFVTDELLRRFFDKRDKGKDFFWTEKSLEPANFLRLLELQPSVPALNLINQLVPHLTTDSKNFTLKINLKNGHKAEAIVRDHQTSLEVLHWLEPS